MSPSEMPSLLFVADLVELASRGPFVASLVPEGADGDAPLICASGFGIPLWLDLIVEVTVGSFVVGFGVGKSIVAVIRTDGDCGVGTLRIDVAVSQGGECEVVRPEVGYVVVHGGARGVGVTKSIVCVKLLDDDTQSALK